MSDPHVPKRTRPEFPDYRYTATLLRKLGECQENVRYYREHLQDHVEADPQRLKAWNEFLAAGGVTAKDLWHWNNGEELHRPGIKQKKHLRLVSNKIVRYRPRLSDEGGEAA